MVLDVYYYKNKDVTIMRENTKIIFIAVAFCLIVISGAIVYSQLNNNSNNTTNNTTNDTANNTTNITDNTTLNESNQTNTTNTQTNTKSQSTKKSSSKKSSSSSSSGNDGYHYSAQYGTYIKEWTDSSGSHMKSRDGKYEGHYNEKTGVLREKTPYGGWTSTNMKN